MLSGTEEGKKLKEDILWDKALKRAKGDKLKDDPKRIKAAIKREQKKKAKSAAEWKERNASVAKQQQERQEKRQRNIEEKILKRKEKKIKKVRIRLLQFPSSLVCSLLLLHACMFGLLACLLYSLQL